MTINGKSVEMVVEELRKPFSEDELDKSELGYYYVNGQKCINRLNEALGLLNYSIECRETHFDEYCIYKTVDIIIFDDEGNEVVRKSGCGGYRYIYPKESESLAPKDPQNAHDSAFTDAVKRACKLLGVGIDVYHKNRVATGKESPQNFLTENGCNSGQGEVFCFTFKEPLKQDGYLKNSFHALVKTDMGKEFMFIIWQEDFIKLTQKGIMSSFMDISNRLGNLRIIGTSQVFGAKGYPQIVFKGVPDNG